MTMTVNELSSRYIGIGDKVALLVTSQNANNLTQ